MGGPTVSVVDPEIPFSVAPIIVDPVTRPVAKPPESIVATESLEDDQVTRSVMSCVLPSLYKPLAVNCRVVVGRIKGFVGVTVIERNVAASTTKRYEEIAPVSGLLPPPAVVIVEVASCPSVA